MNVTFRSRQELAPHVWEYTFTPEKPIDYTPGQYARFWFPFDIHDTRGKYHRTFSLTSHPSDDTIRFIVRLEEPLSVFKAPLTELKAGDTMLIDEPHGDAILPRLETTPLIFVAQGIALASYVSILRDVRDRKLNHPITLFWAHRESDTSLEVLIPELTTHAQRYDIVAPGRITVDDIMKKNNPDSLVYLSGGQSFVETIGATLEARGIPRERIIYDYYEGYAEL